MTKFGEFMKDWLYGADGYYQKYKAIGKEGDFYTAVSSSRFFGGSIANYLITLIDEGTVPEDTLVCEIGAHKGYLLADIVQFIYTLRPSLLETLRFGIVEPFENLRKVQKEYFENSFGETIALEHFESLGSMSEKSGFVVANEIFDAFACELVYKGQMGYVKDFTIRFEKIDTDIKRIAEKYGIIKGEIALGYEEFAKELYNAFEKVEFVTFDYGDLEARNDFSIRVYKKHEVYPLFDEKLDIKEVYKRADITYDVNFSHLIDAFIGAGFSKKAYKTQLLALVDFGLTELLDMLKNRVPENVYIREANKVKTLIHPAMMGERFKMLSVTK
ncbi:SAM-dependent methyltransferase [Nitrosophilus alvini]|uniref:SAM-dependent methyltransferase n=1 Tax=Nitrosophilus alvini TaxID=2714855 RepID=UPI00190908EB|nr:SAM-dependent methyltransferase [Nitrosophilus alvini]